MKVLFLEIDGVCNNRYTPQGDAWPIDPDMAYLVRRIVQETGAIIVLSSSWRHAPEGVQVVSDRVTKVHYTTTLNAGSRAMRRYGTISRGTEIQMWLDEWNKETLSYKVKHLMPLEPSGYSNEEIECYAILDDDGDMLFKQKPNFFQTSFLTGLTREIAEKVIVHLNS